MSYKQITAETTLQDLEANPNDYGIPSFEQFVKNPEPYRKHREALLNMVDNGSKTLVGLKKQIYYVEGVKCNNLEHAQKVIEDMGISLDDLEIKPNLEDLGNGTYNCHTYFKRKSKLILPGDLK